MLINGIFERHLSARHNPARPPAFAHGARLGPGLGGPEHKGRQWHRPCTSRSGPFSHVRASPSRSQAVQGRPQAARTDIAGAASLPQPAPHITARTSQQGVNSLLDHLNALASLLQQPPAEPQPPPAQQLQLQPQQIWPAAATVARISGSTSQQQQGLGHLVASSSYINIRPTSNSRSGNTSTSSRRSIATPAAAAVTQRALPHGTVRAAATRQAAATSLVAASAAGSGGAGTEDDVVEVVDLSGLWAKDRDRSDAKGYDAILDVLGLSGLQKVTARLIEGLEIRQSADQFTVNFVTVVPFFKVTEVVPLNAGSTQQSRRDLRHGTQTAAAKTVDGGVFVEMSWGQPMAGGLTEVYSLLPDGSLCVHAEVRVGEKQASADTIYTLSKGSRDALLSDSKRRNGS